VSTIPGSAGWGWMALISAAGVSEVLRRGETSFGGRAGRFAGRLSGMRISLMVVTADTPALENGHTGLVLPGAGGLSAIDCRRWWGRLFPAGTAGDTERLGHGLRTERDHLCTSRANALVYGGDDGDADRQLDEMFGDLRDQPSERRVVLHLLHGGRDLARELPPPTADLSQVA